jgi:hypothetical protein
MLVHFQSARKRVRPAARGKGTAVSLADTIAGEQFFCRHEMSCLFAGMNRIRFKGVPRCLYKRGWRSLSSLPEPPSDTSNVSATKVSSKAGVSTQAFRTSFATAPISLVRYLLKFARFYSDCH